MLWKFSCIVNLPRLLSVASTAKLAACVQSLPAELRGVRNSRGKRQELRRMLSAEGHTVLRAIGKKAPAVAGFERALIRF